MASLHKENGSEYDESSYSDFIPDIPNPLEHDTAELEKIKKEIEKIEEIINKNRRRGTQYIPTNIVEIKK